MDGLMTIQPFSYEPIHGFGYRGGVPHRNLILHDGVQHCVDSELGSVQSLSSVGAHHAVQLLRVTLSQPSLSIGS